MNFLKRVFLRRLVTKMAAIHISLLVLFVSFGIIFSDTQHVFAQGSLSGDSLCGSSSSTKCKLSDVKQLFKTAGVTFLWYSTLFLVLMASWRILRALNAYNRGNAGAFKEAMSQIWEGFLGVVIVALVVGGAVTAIIASVGLRPEFLNILNLFSEALISHTYAADSGYLPCPTTSCEIGNYVTVVFTLFMRWIVYPSLVAFWVYSGFMLVYARGAPDKLKEARKRIFVTLIVTIFIMMLGGLLYAIQSTLQGVTSTQTSSAGQTTTPSPTPYAPAQGQLGASCQDASGLYGRIGTDGKCYTNGGCTGKNEGDSCMVGSRRGTCTYNETGVFACYAIPNITNYGPAAGAPGSMCFDSVSNLYGQWTTDGKCAVRGIQTTPENQSAN